MSDSKKIKGRYYDGRASQSHLCSFYVNEQGYLFIDEIKYGCDFSELKISDRIGKTARVITFPKGAYLETDQHEQIDLLIKKFCKNRTFFNLHHFESKPAYIVLSVFCLVAFSYILLNHIVPVVSKHIAHGLPAAMSTQLANGVLDQLDDHYFTGSKLPDGRKQQLTTLFEELTSKTDGYHYKLYFRQGGIIGANALALPDGSVIITDELVNLTDNNLEILSVLLHEMGHIEHRHSMIAAIESAGTTVFFMWLIGDVELVGELIVVLPAILMRAKYSRDHEWEADTFALKKMQVENYDPIHFARMMKKLSDHARESSIKNDDSPGFIDFLSSHPPSKERINRFQEASKN